MIRIYYEFRVRTNGRDGGQRKQHGARERPVSSIHQRLLSPSLPVGMIDRVDQGIEENCEVHVLWFACPLRYIIEKFEDGLLGVFRLCEFGGLGRAQAVEVLHLERGEDRGADNHVEDVRDYEHQVRQ